MGTELLAVSMIFHAFTSSLFPGSLDMQREAIEKKVKSEDGAITTNVFLL